MRESHLEQSYMPVAVAADVAGYDVSTVYKLIKKGKVKGKLSHGRMTVHLGSLLSRCKRGDKREQVQRWLKNHLMYKSLARQASTELGYDVSLTTVHEAMQELRNFSLTPQ